ncbi:MAG: HAD hydrolase family protein [Lachnospiraceae bacterium]|nr:HAD hydrolase family protein [Lachnospiraceae bacterium]
MFENIELIVYDFDGVMTDNRVMVDQDGRESVMANRGDGYGVGMIRKLGIEQVILSTEVNPVVEMRAEKLKLEVIHGVSDKKETLVKFCSEKAVGLDKVMYIGNDLNDIDAMGCVGLKGAPKDAEPEILEIADWVSGKNGGYGVVRELARLISGERNA